MDIAFGDGEVAVGPRSETLVGVDFDTVECINEIYHRGEINFEVVIDRDI